MSETEHHVGKLIKVDTSEGELVDSVMLRLLIANDVDMSKGYDLREYFEDEFYRSHVVIGGAVYKIDSKKFDDCEDIMEASYDSDGNIDFQVKFYNGGCGLNEALEEAFDNINK